MNRAEELIADLEAEIVKRLAMNERIEHCNCCDAATGRAGINDDSLFRASEGPFCEECYESWPEEIINQRDALAADNQRLREALESAESLFLLSIDAKKFWFDGREIKADGDDRFYSAKKVEAFLSGIHAALAANK